MKDEIELVKVSVVRELIRMKRVDVGDEVFEKNRKIIMEEVDTKKSLKKSSNFRELDIDFGLFEDVEDSHDSELLYATTPSEISGADFEKFFLPSREYLVSGKDLHRFGITPQHLSIDRDVDSVISAVTLNDARESITENIPNYDKIKEGSKQWMHGAININMRSDSKLDNHVNFEEKLKAACSLVYEEYLERSKI